MKLDQELSLFRLKEKNMAKLKGGVNCGCSKEVLSI